MRTRPDAPDSAPRPRPLAAGVLVGALAWVLMLQFFVVEAVAQAAWTPAYSYADQHISALGNARCGSGTADLAATGQGSACSPLHRLMNASFIVNGVLIPLGAALAGRAWPRRRATTLGLAVFALAGPGTAMVGLWPADVHPPLHAIGAAVFLIAGNLGMIMIGLAAWRTRRWPARAALPAGAIGLAGTILWVTGTFLGLGDGGMERVAVYPVVIWPAVQGMALVAAAARGRRDQTSAPTAKTDRLSD